MLSFYGVVMCFRILLDMLVASREPTPCYFDAYSVGTPKWALWRKGWSNHCKTTFSPRLDVFSWLAKGLYSFFFWILIWMSHIVRARHPGPGQRLFTLVNCRLSLFMWVGG